MELSDAPEKNPQWPGIDPGTLRLVAQSLNHYATPGPKNQSVHGESGTFAVCSQINTKHIQCGQSVQLLNVKLVGASRNK